MKRKSIRAAAILLLFAFVLTMSGCAGEDADAGAVVSIYFRHPYETEAILPYLAERFPEVTFEYMVGDNGVEHLAMMAERGDIPDIFMVDGESKSLGVLGKYCYDLRETEVAASVFSSYRRRFTNPDGSIYVLPSLGDPSGMLVNKTLLEENDIPLPTDYDAISTPAGGLPKWASVDMRRTENTI